MNFRIRKHIQPSIIYVCDGCGIWKPGKGQCPACGRLDHIVFRSKLEAKRWAQLLLQLKLGKIKNLRRQVSFDLLAYGPGDLPVKVAKYVADFVYERDGATVIEDVKPSKKRDPVVDRLAQLKLDWMKAMGFKINTVTPEQ